MEHEITVKKKGKLMTEGVECYLRPCPFCGSTNLELCNTHTPSFWVECLDCKGQAHGEYFEGQYTKAWKSAVIAWNRRA